VGITRLTGCVPHSEERVRVAREAEDEELPGDAARDAEDGAAAGDSEFQRENLNRRYGTGSRAGGGRRRSTMRISKGDRDDNTNYEAVAETSASPRKTKAFRFGDPAQNRLRDADSLKRMQSWLACEKVDGGRTKYGDATDLRMAHWIEAHVERVEAEAQACALEEAAKQNKYRRASHYGNIMDKADGAAVMSGYAGNTLSMTSDPTGLPAAMKAEKRRTMAYVKT